MKYKLKKGVQLDIFESYHGLLIFDWRELNAGKAVELDDRAAKRLEEFLVKVKENKKNNKKDEVE